MSLFYGSSWVTTARKVHLADKTSQRAFESVNILKLNGCVAVSQFLFSDGWGAESLLPVNIYLPQRGAERILKMSFSNVTTSEAHASSWTGI